MLFYAVSCQIVSASEIICMGRIGNVYYSGKAAGETQYQNEAIAILCYEYIQKYFPWYKGNVYLELGFWENRNGEAKITYDFYEGRAWEYAKKNRPAKGKGIRIQFSHTTNRAENVLKLLDLSLKNFKKIKKWNKKYNRKSTKNNKREEEEYGIVKIFDEPTNPEIDSTLQIKIPRLLRGNKEYYIQNDKYYFTDFFRKDSVYLELDRIYQIISEHYLGTIIFVTDSTGYFYSRKTGKLSEMFLIPNKTWCYYYTHTSSDHAKGRIYFELYPCDIYDSNQITRKFIYLTKKLFLVQDIEKQEDSWIEQVLEKND